ncbi:DUF1538 domain-containing protein [Candidatus Dependentiae bacterium]|nr:DUF1538 domain-containing protein [Candidatus Dependentiae bacterium]
MKSEIKKIQMTWKQKIDLLVPYVKKKVIEQIKAVALIIIYLVLFQTLILGIAIAEAGLIASGIAIVVFGLAFFMEGLFLGLMPLGEVIGVKLPQKSGLFVILVFSFILGVGVTFAEPAIGVLKAAGAFVKAWDAPLLFLLLNKYSNYLVYAVGIGVGMAVVSGMLRFIYNWSLKPFLYGGVVILTALSIWAEFNPNLRYVIGLAWDCGGVTTGPVTVPLVLALGIGISRIVSKGSSELSGFGVVTLASLFPIFTVIICGTLFLNKVPVPTVEKLFFTDPSIQEKSKYLFVSDIEYKGYALKNASPETLITLLGGKEQMLDFIEKIKNTDSMRKIIFGSEDIAVFERWLIDNGTQEQKLKVFGNIENINNTVKKYFFTEQKFLNVNDLITRNFFASMQAIIPLVIFLIIILMIILREKLPQPDEVFLGVVFSVIGMLLFNIGIELGLAKLGNQVGSKLPSSFKSIELVESKKIITNFDESVMQTAITPSGEKEKIFYIKNNNQYERVPYKNTEYDPISKTYIYTPIKSPMFGVEKSFGGYLIAILFAFVMGYGATLAEPALNALGLTVEELTVGTFKKSLLMQTVAIGVGIGISAGLAKIIWNIPLIWILVPPYAILMYLTKVSSEEYVNIGWDSAGVTTGPITVPLVLALGLGIGNQINVVEGFGILATASAFPILSVLSVGLYVNYKRKKMQATE